MICMLFVTLLTISMCTLYMYVHDWSSWSTNVQIYMAVMCVLYMYMHEHVV